MNALNRFAAPFYCITRLVVGLMFACHGLGQDIRRVYSEKRSASHLDGHRRLGGNRLRISRCVWSADATRLVSSPPVKWQSAFFMMHASEGLTPDVNKGELAVVYCFVFLHIFLRGSGGWSIDAMMGKGKASVTTPH